MNVRREELWLLRSKYLVFVYGQRTYHFSTIVNMCDRADDAQQRKQQELRAGRHRGPDYHAHHERVRDQQSVERLAPSVAHL